MVGVYLITNKVNGKVYVKKLADAQTGKKFSKESREKMALKARLAWVKRKQGI